MFVRFKSNYNKCRKVGDFTKIGNFEVQLQFEFPACQQFNICNYSKYYIEVMDKKVTRDNFKSIDGEQKKKKT